jgi:hypothetical protein
MNTKADLAGNGRNPLDKFFVLQAGEKPNIVRQTNGQASPPQKHKDPDRIASGSLCVAESGRSRS